MPLTSNLITRFPNGFTNVPVGNVFNDLKQEDPTLYHQYFEDFDYFPAANWTVTETQAGATQALADGDGGLLLLTNSAANADVNQVQKIGASFLPIAGKKFFMRIRAKVDDATLAVFYAGLQIANVDGSLGTVTDGIYFIKAAAATSMSFNVRKNTTTGATTAVVGAIANDTFFVVDCFFDGIDRVYFGLNGTVIGSVDGSAAFLPDAAIAPIIGVKNGSAVARICTADYIFVAQER